MFKLYVLILYIITTTAISVVKCNDNCTSEYKTLHGNSTVPNINICANIYGCSWCYEDTSCRSWDPCRETASHCKYDFYVSKETRNGMKCDTETKRSNIRLHIALIVIGFFASAVLALINLYLFSRKFRHFIKKPKSDTEVGKFYNLVEKEKVNDDDDDDDDDFKQTLEIE